MIEPSRHFGLLTVIMGLALAGCDTEKAREAARAEALQQKTDLCLEHLKPSLKDPYSVKVFKASVSPGNPNVIAIDYHAKNSFGAYMPGEFKCSIVDGKVDEGATRTLNAIARLNQEIAEQQAYNNCLIESNANLARGEAGRDCQKPPRR